MRIAAGSDHAGLELKRHLVRWLEERGHEVLDLGTDSPASTDYPVYARKVAEAVARGEAERGLVVCGTGIGTDIVANKVRGVRAARCLTEYDARYARRHNDANVLSLGGRVLGAGLAEAVLQVFLETPFDGGRHERRVRMIEPEP
ncbi:MAG: ribose 5-phosphate isomerase B [Acidobacteria bacterium]|nr:MAG: ribose 5-phosphate isomerase B [Acidobacteriota bacterium]